jgi:hypothetical protein
LTRSGTDLLTGPFRAATGGDTPHLGDTASPVWVTYFAANLYITIFVGKAS